MNSNWTDLIHRPVDVPNRAGLRRSAFIVAGSTIVLFGGLIPQLLGTHIVFWPLGLALVLFIWGLLAPRSLRKPYVVWIRLGMFIGQLTTPIVLAVLFYGIILPVGVLRRLIGDPLDKRFDSQAESYRKKLPEAPRNNLEKPF